MRHAFVAALAALLMSCAGQPDHFYSLTTLNDGVRPPGTAFTTHVILSMSIPPAVDRREMVVNASGDQLLILEHERWAAPMSELAAQTLARDIEQRRADVLVGDRSFDQSTVPPVKVTIDVVQMSARRGGSATLEAHWRIVDAAAHVDEIGGETFSAPLEGDAYAAVAKGFSEDLGKLATRLAEKLPRH
jgi:uncharacterized lipoprotein YmbA